MLLASPSCASRTAKSPETSTACWIPRWATHLHVYGVQ
jgi:hypothetical protein